MHLAELNLNSNDAFAYYFYYQTSPKNAEIVVNYQTLLNIVNSDGWDNTGVYPENAKRLLFDCCDTAIKKIEKRLMS